MVGVMIMFETRGFWGLEDNSNANTINATLSTYTVLPIVIVVIIIVAACALMMTTRLGFS